MGKTDHTIDANELMRKHPGPWSAVLIYERGVFPLIHDAVGNRVELYRHRPVICTLANQHAAMTEREAKVERLTKACWVLRSCGGNDEELYAEACAGISSALDELAALDAVRGEEGCV